MKGSDVITLTRLYTFAPVFDRSSRVQFTTNKWWQKRTLTNSETCRATPTATVGPRRRFHFSIFFFF